MKTEADGLGIETWDDQAEEVLTTLLDQFLTATDLLGATAGLRVDLLRWMIVALVGIGVVALVRLQPTGHRRRYEKDPVREGPRHRRASYGRSLTDGSPRRPGEGGCDDGAVRPSPA